MMRGRGHLSDDQLIEVCLELAASPATEQHLDSCADCESRRERLALILQEATDAMAQDVDAVFTPERLAKQRARIMHRVEQDGRPARIIAFPAASADAAAPRRRPAMRWLAGAAAAGLIVGLVAGHFTRQGARPGPQSRTEVVTRAVGASPTPTLRAATAGPSDDEVIGQIEAALGSPSASVLLPLDELTPLAWEGQ